MNKKNVIKTIILGIAAAVFAMQTNKDREAMQFARQRVGHLRQQAKIVEKFWDANGVYIPAKTYDEWCKRYKDQGIMPPSVTTLCPKCSVRYDLNILLPKHQCKDLAHEQEVEVSEPNQTELCDLYGSAVTVDEEHGIKQEWHEPNEPECKHENTGPSFCLVHHPPGEECIACYDCGEYITTKEIEPEFSTEGITFVPFDISKIIPTWPQYIELDKDLVAVIPTERKVSGYTESEVKTIYPKGTKIYFKDKE